MKKLFVGISAAALAAVMCAAFAGCGSKAKDIKGYEVTEEQWNAAFEALRKDDAVFTIDCSKKISEKANSGGTNATYTGTSTYTVIKNNAKEYVKSVETEKYVGTASGGMLPPSTEEIDEMYAERIGNGYTIYEKNEAGEWETTEHGDSIVSFDNIFGEVFNGTGILVDGEFVGGTDAILYSLYEYSTKDKGYIPASAGEGDHPYVIKFDQDGRLSAIYRSFEKTQGYMSGSYTFSVVISYTAKEISLPTVA